jgi:hypothetical protein
MLHMRLQPELVVDSFYRRTVLTVECIASRHDSAEGAARLRDLLLPEDLEIDPCFFMLTRLSVINLWVPGHSRGALPDYTAPALPILQQYLANTDYLYRAILRNVMARWLESFSYGRPANTTEAEQMLVASGLYEKLKDGYVRDFDT